MKQHNEAPKVKLLLNSSVVEGRAEEGTVTLMDVSVKADLIVVTDGVHSMLRDVMLKHTAPKTSPTGLSAFRFVIPTDSLREDPQLIDFFERKCEGPTILADACGVQREGYQNS